MARLRDRSKRRAPTYEERQWLMLGVFPVPDCAEGLYDVVRGEALADLDRGRPWYGSAVLDEDRAVRRRAIGAMIARIVERCPAAGGESPPPRSGDDVDIPRHRWAQVRRLRELVDRC